jgi:hypothetical protein
MCQFAEGIEVELTVAPVVLYRLAIEPTKKYPLFVAQDDTVAERLLAGPPTDAWPYPQA